jgi:hypothetical protein
MKLCPGTFTVAISVESWGHRPFLQQVEQRSTKLDERRPTEIEVTHFAKNASVEPHFARKFNDDHSLT